MKKGSSSRPMTSKRIQKLIAMCIEADHFIRSARIKAGIAAKRKAGNHNKKAKP